MVYIKTLNKFKLKNITHVFQISKNKDKILQDFSSLYSPFRKSAKKTIYENVDRGLKNLITNCNNMGVAINDLILREKASEIGKTSGQTEFKSSNGYLRNFKRRIGVESKGKHGDANLVPSQTINDWKIKLKELIKSYES